MVLFDYVRGRRGDRAHSEGEMIPCVDCGYISPRGQLHWGCCLLILLQWIHIEGKGENLCEFEKLSSEEIHDLALMENEMLDRGAEMDTEGYFGKCVVEN